MQHGSWFFDGYQVEQTEKGRKLEYVGPWYGFCDEGRLRILKIRLSALVAMILLPFFAAQLFPSPGGMTRWTAAPSMLSLVPMMFLVIGWVNFLLSKDAWEIRTYYAGYRRLYRSGICQLVLFGLWLLSELVYTGMHLEKITGELYYLACVLICVSGTACLVGMVQRHPVQVVRGPLIK